MTPKHRAGTAPSPLKKCTGPCLRRLPLSSYSIASGRKDGRRSECRECRRSRRGPRGKEGREARALEQELWVLREVYGGVPSLAEILSRMMEEVRQVGATGAKLDEQVGAVRRAVITQGCRSADEVIEETGLSRWAVGRALEILVAEKRLETRDRFSLPDVEPGRPVTEYHPTDTPRGELFTYLLERAADDELP